MSQWRQPEGLMALMSQPGIGPAGASARAQTGDLTGLNERELRDHLQRSREVVQSARQREIEPITCFDERFPIRLRDIPSAPALLWVRGNAAQLNETLIAVVGTRRPTVFGETAARAVTEAVCAAGGGVCSGLALGVDGIVHETALASAAANVIVLAGGVADDDIHPRRHQPLASAVLEAGGVIVSENPPGTKTTPALLVARNRLQAGLSVCTVVIQTGLSGGTPHTARFAMAQGRPLFCPQPRSRDERSAGNWALLEAPAPKLPELMPAFRDAAGLCRRFGDRPAAQPLTRENIAAWAAATVAATPQQLRPPPSLF